MKQTTKQCPQCGTTHLVLIPTYNKKRCTDCNIWINWTLDEGQQPMYPTPRNLTKKEVKKDGD